MRQNTTSSCAPDGSSEGSDPTLRGPAWVGTQIDTGAQAPVAGTWEIVDHPDHPDCPGIGELRALGRGDRAPDCPRCDQSATWQLTHLALTVATEHPDPSPRVRNQ